MASRGNTRGCGRPKGSRNKEKTAPAVPNTNGHKKQRLDGEAVPAVDPPISIAPDTEENIGRPKRACASLAPGLPEVKRAKRSHAEVEAEKAEKAAAQVALLPRRERAIAELAAIDAAQDKASVEAEENSILTIEDVDDTMDVDADGGPILEFTQDDFDRVDNDEESEDESPSSIEGFEEGGQAFKEEEPKKGVQNSDAAAASKTAGISKRWAQTAASKAPDANPPPSPALGGLSENDAHAERPERSSDAPPISR
ncbi:hypothetical protein C8R44DRAFT_894286 [Mycena epipterygia]|nr:hypothetical protein C8R44DRAFT_894278 [Mycena epipterygia]KAJ7084145.1 hypothetical protein C8R44DRAFT_894286 [Mycena epipterygia]